MERPEIEFRYGGEAHVVRLAAIYAALDCSDQIAPPHLEAGLAVWRYSLDSARWIFGDNDPLYQLRAGGGVIMRPCRPARPS